MRDIPVGDLDALIVWWLEMRQRAMVSEQSALEQTAASLSSDFRNRGIDLSDALQRRTAWAAFEIAAALGMDSKTASGVLLALAEIESANEPIERRNP